MNTTDLTEPVVNVGECERVISGSIGVLLILSSICKGSLFHTLIGGCFLYRAFSGNCKGYQIFGVSTCSLPKPSRAFVEGSPLQ